MTDTVFLSASVPDPKRGPEYAATADTVAITAAVSALVHVSLGRRLIVWCHLVARIGRLASGAGRCRTTAPSRMLGPLPCRSKPRQPVAATFRSSSIE